MQGKSFTKEKTKNARFTRLNYFKNQRKHTGNTEKTAGSKPRDLANTHSDQIRFTCAQLVHKTQGVKIAARQKIEPKAGNIIVSARTCSRND